MKELVYIVPLMPLIGFLINGLFWRKMPKSISGTLASLMVLVSFGISVGIFMELRDDASAQIVELFPFFQTNALSIPFAFQIDTLSSTFLLIITGIGFLIHIYSIGYMHDDEGYTKFFAYLNLFVFSMLILVLGANYVMMFIGWEGVGLASYLLIGFWFKNRDYTNASKKAFIMNRIGDLGFLVGMLLTAYHFSSLTYETVFATIGTINVDESVYTAIAFCFFIGAMGKSAQIPLYTWLPDAMAGPTPVSALIHAATMVTAGIYMIARSSAIYNLAPIVQNFVAIIGLITAIFAATIALKQYDIKKVLAYSTVSQLGFMFLALGVGSYVGGVFHVMTHAFFKALLFLGAGSVIHGMSNEQDIRMMGGLKKYMPVTHFTFLIGCLAIAGIPFFSGFFSKDEILAAAFAKNPIYFVGALFAAMMTAFYMFRLYFLVFTGTFRGTEHHKSHLHESPKTMTIPLIVLAILSVLGGYIGLPLVVTENHMLAEWLGSTVTNHGVEHLPHSTEWMLMGISTVLVIIMIIVARKATQQPKFDEYTGLNKVLYNKWYVDELYDNAIVKPLFGMSTGLKNGVEKKGIDGIVNGVGQFVTWTSTKIRLLQSGQIGHYLFGFVIGVVILLFIAFAPLI